MTCWLITGACLLHLSLTSRHVWDLRLLRNSGGVFGNETFCKLFPHLPRSFCITKASWSSKQREENRSRSEDTVFSITIIIIYTPKGASLFGTGVCVREIEFLMSLMYPYWSALQTLPSQPPPGSNPIKLHLHTHTHLNTPPSLWVTAWGSHRLPWQITHFKKWPTHTIIVQYIYTNTHPHAPCDL